MSKTKSESGILASIHKTAAGLHKAGLVDRPTMREFDGLCCRSIDIVDLTEEEVEQLTTGRMEPEHRHLDEFPEDDHEKR